jgi:serine/threonine protein kinase
MVLRGKYEIEGKLGAGGMAAVYRARHLAFGEVRAIKVVNSRLADDEDFLRRFRNEAVVARRLHHPNAVRVDDLDMTEDGRPFIVMEYVEGQNLREMIRREGALSLRRSVRIARQVASALAAAHELGIIHRDIKPDNILLAGAGPEETAKVLDFGIAKMKEGALGDSGALMTRTGMVVGTPQYISPEQAMGRRGSELDGRADLYSLGVVLYEMVTGRLPFESDTAMGLILHHLQTPPPPPRDLRPELDIPDPLSAVLLRALEKEPEKRFSSAAEMAGALEEVLALPLPERAGTAEAAPGSARPPTPAPVPFDIDRHETRAMPRTPPVPGRSPAPTAVAAARTPPPIPRTPPPLPHTPVPSATVAPGRLGTTSTPVPSPTVFTSAAAAGGATGGAFTPPPLPPPPLPPATAPPPTTVFEPPRGRLRGKRPWWIWIVAAAMVYSLCGRDRSRSRARRDARPSPSASVAGEEVESEARAAREGEIAAAVERALRANPRTRRQDIDVDVDEGIVTLSGSAPAAAARDAEQMARHVDGVRGVVNVIAIEGAEGAIPDGAVPSPGGHAGPPPSAPLPPVPGNHPWGNPETVQRLLREGREALKAGEAGKAMGKFGTALAMDPRNDEARRGMQDAAMMLRDHGRQKPKE